MTFYDQVSLENTAIMQLYLALEFKFSLTLEAGEDWETGLFGFCINYILGRDPGSKIQP